MGRTRSEDAWTSAAGLGVRDPLAVSTSVSGTKRQPAANSNRQSATSNYVTMAPKSCNDSHVGVIQQPD